jgi:hypothetical protein
LPPCLEDQPLTVILSSRPAKGDLAGAMAKQANLSVVPSDTRVNRGQTDQARGFSWSDPEEGHRLMRAFLSIREAALREAIITFVEFLAEVSKLHHDEQ